jgi:cupin fold WbuC family metalloprotein
MSEVMSMPENFIQITSKQLRDLQQRASDDPKRRARICLHKDHRDRLQEMVIAICKDSYICPHRQIDKLKTYKLVVGNMLVVFFNESGIVEQKIEMGSIEEGKTAVFRFSSHRWHTVISLTEITIYMETIAGPYSREETEFASWGPDAGEPEVVEQYLDKILDWR